MRRMKSAPTGCKTIKPFRHREASICRVSRWTLQMDAILAGGCRARYELLDGRGREVLVEEAGEALSVEGLGE